MERSRLILEAISGDRNLDGFEIQISTRYHWSLVGERWVPLLDPSADFRGAVNAFGVRACNRLGQVTRWEMAEDALKAWNLRDHMVKFSDQLDFGDEE